MESLPLLLIRLFFPSGYPVEKKLFWLITPTHFPIMTPSSGSKRCVILGVLRNLEVDGIRPFFESLKATGYDGDVVMFCTKISAQTECYLTEQGVKIVPFAYWAIKNHQPMLLIWPFWRWVIGLLPSFKAKTAVARYVWFLFYLRFLLYYEFLVANPNYERIMITDVRDVWFQRDPFAWMHGEEGLFCFEEILGRTIGNCSSNSELIREAVGPKRASLVSDCQVSCAGVTFGTRDAMLLYLHKFCELAFTAHRPKTSTGSDQGVHNWIVHRETIPGLRLLNNEGPVNTMGLYQNEAIRTDGLGHVVNAVGEVQSVLHQYDRFPQISKMLSDTLRSVG